jgi:hypothetical protein
MALQAVRTGRQPVREARPAFEAACGRDVLNSGAERRLLLPLLRQPREEFVPKTKMDNRRPTASPSPSSASALKTRAIKSAI